MLISYFTDPRKKSINEAFRSIREIWVLHIYTLCLIQTLAPTLTLSCPVSQMRQTLCTIFTLKTSLQSVQVSWYRLSPAVHQIRLQPSSSSQSHHRHRCAGNGRKMIQEGEWLPGGLCGDGGVSWGGGTDRGVLDRSVLDQRDSQVQVLLQRQNHTLEQEVEALETLALSHDTKTRL